MQTKKWLLIAISILVFVSLACNAPFALRGGEEVEPTPNMTMTALFSIPELATATSAPVVVVTNTPEPATATVEPTATAIPATATVTNTAVPTATSIPARGVVTSAAYLGSGVDLDGVWDEWNTKAYPMKSVVYGKSNWTGEEDLEGSYRVGWNSSYLFIAVKVRDDKYEQHTSGANLYKGDSIELLLDTNLYDDFYTTDLSADDHQLGISAGKNDSDDTEEAYLWYPSGKAGDKDNVQIGKSLEKGVYRIEAAIPWSVFGITPYSGMHLGFAISVSDNDASWDEQQSMVSSIATRKLTNPTTWGELILQ